MVVTILTYKYVTIDVISDQGCAFEGEVCAGNETGLRSVFSDDAIVDFKLSALSYTESLDFRHDGDLCSGSSPWRGWTPTWG